MNRKQFVILLALVVVLGALGWNRLRNQSSSWGGGGAKMRAAAARSHFRAKTHTRSHSPCFNSPRGALLRARGGQKNTY